VCHDHFKDNDYNYFTRRHLAETTVLSININMCEKTVKTENNKNVPTVNKSQKTVNISQQKKIQLLFIRSKKKKLLDGQIENMITNHNVQHDEILNRI